MELNNNTELFMLTLINSFFDCNVSIQSEIFCLLERKTFGWSKEILELRLLAGVQIVRPARLYSHHTSIILEKNNQSIGVVN